MEGDDAVNQEHAGSQQMLAIAGAAKANTSVNASEGRDGPGSRDDSFYLRYYAGHKGKFGHEFFGEYGEMEERDKQRVCLDSSG